MWIFLSSPIIFSFRVSCVRGAPEITSLFGVVLSLHKFWMKEGLILNVIFNDYIQNQSLFHPACSQN